jgi:hypothetical protein
MHLPPLPACETPGPPVQLLSDSTGHGVLRLTALLGHPGKWPGAAFHAVLAAWLASGPPDEGRLPEWCREHLTKFARLAGIKTRGRHPWRAERFEQAASTADGWWRRGLRVYSWGDAGGPPRGGPEAVCPQVLFGRGHLPSGRPWVALFNSRKPRDLRPDDRWLVALRQVLAELARLPATFAGSCGTLTYDLVATFAQERRLPLVLVTCEPLSEGLGAAGCAEHDDGLPAGDTPAGMLSCAVQPLACPKPARLLCRDRLLAHLADLHVHLEIRDRGNLLQVLRDQQRHRPKRQWVLEAVKSSAACRGNEALLRESPQWSRVISIGDDRIADPKPGPAQGPPPGGIQGAVQAGADLGKHPPTPLNTVDLRRGDTVTRRRGDRESATAPCLSPKSTALPIPLKGGTKSTGAALLKGEAKALARERYLYHYTRPCPGPWPGQSYRDYLDSLLEGEGSCGHDALDTLERILSEGCIRGSHRLVRGVDAVVSWTSRPPQDLTEMRRWNRGLMRWTFEPYGIALNRRELRRLGAKPAVYGTSQLYQELSPEERYRFQSQGSTGMSWKLEREWRLLGDLVLHEDMDAFVFVPTASDAEELERRGQPIFPVRVLGKHNSQG